MAEQPVSMHVVAVLAVDGVLLFDLATPVELFGRVRSADGAPLYDVRVCSATDTVDAGPVAVRPPHRLDCLAQADTVVVAGAADPMAVVPEQVLDALRQAAARGARIASICVGAFVLAAAGLLDERRATTHWAAADLLARSFPRVEVDPSVLYVDDGELLTSAGAAAGLDLCLHLVRRDHGVAIAAAAARAAVMPLERSGGQAQFITHAVPDADGDSLEPLLQWMREHAHEILSLEQVAARACLSPRTLSRRFRQQTGTTPLQWLQSARLIRAQQLLETTDHTVERIAADTGFGTTTSLRERFRRTLGTTPHSYRQAFRRTA